MINYHFHAEKAESLTLSWNKPDNLQCIGKTGPDAEGKRSEGLEVGRGESDEVEQPLTCRAAIGTGHL